MGSLARVLFCLAFVASISACTKKSEERGPASLPAPEVKTQVEAEDPYLWLEEVHGERAMQWVTRQNEKTLTELNASPQLKQNAEGIKTLMSSRDRLVVVTFLEDKVLQFYDDANHPRGYLRSIALDKYEKEQANNSSWKSLLDIGALNKEEGESWVYKGYLPLGGKSPLAMVMLSVGGSDTFEYREFDLEKGNFVSSGFVVPPAKTFLDWADADTLIVASDFGPGSLTASGYARTARALKRGQNLSEAAEIFAGAEADVMLIPTTLRHREEKHTLLQHRVSFFETDHYLVKNEGGVFQTVLLPLPRGVDDITLYEGKFLFVIKKDWQVAGQLFLAGSLVSWDFSSWSHNQGMRVSLLLPPDMKRIVQGVTATNSRIFVSLLETVQSRVYEMTAREGGGADLRELPIPNAQSVTLWASNAGKDFVYLQALGYLQAPAIFKEKNSAKPELLRAQAAKFKTDGLKVEQRFATSSDGTQIPYFLVFKEKAEGPQPTLLYGYGGFEVSLLPQYNPTLGKMWLEKGGAYVLANIRGGGEFGPAWHEAVLKENRQLAYDDFQAVARHLISSGVTDPAHLSIQGGSNGGLLMGVTMNQAPELFKAALVQVPLLDMLRFHKLLAGASWIGEYGDPEIPEQRAYIAKYSPYQNFNPEKTYPKAFFITSTADDRVHPGHARKMAALFEQHGKPYLYFENLEGGHGAGADLTQRALLTAYLWTFLQNELGLGL